MKNPKVVLDTDKRYYKVSVESPYNLTEADIIAQAEAEYQNELANYDNVVAESEKVFQQKLQNHDEEVARAKEKFEMESAAFKELTLIERLALMEDNKDPKLRLPSKPVYYKPAEPRYIQPNLNDYLIADNQTLAGRIEISGLTRGESGLDISLTINPISFQEISGKTHASQPALLIVKDPQGKEVVNTTFFQEYDLISDYPLENVNQARAEKKNVDKIFIHINSYLNEMYGYLPESRTIELDVVKNGKNLYDDLEMAHVYITTNLKKMQGTPDSKANQEALSNMNKGIDIWNQTLTNIDYQNKKATLNNEIAKCIYFNFLKLYVGLDRIEDAEKILNQIQENIIKLDLSSGENKELKKLESLIYKS